MHPSDVSVFVRTGVNRNVNMWRAGDTFSICNGRVCTRYRTPHANATLWSADFSFPDAGGGYQGEGSSVSSHTPEYDYHRDDSHLYTDNILGDWHHLSYDPHGRVTIGPLELVCDDEAMMTRNYHDIGDCAKF